MPASLALIKTYWKGPAQRAISLWSMGSWGGSGFAALFGGLMAENVGWRWIFFAAAAISVLGMLMVAGTPESKAETKGAYRFDTAGVLTFMVMMVALQVFATQGEADRMDEPDHARTARDQRRLRGPVLPGRVGQLEARSSTSRCSGT